MTPGKIQQTFLLAAVAMSLPELNTPNTLNTAAPKSGKDMILLLQ